MPRGKKGVVIRTKPIGVRLTPALYQKLEEAALKVGVPPTVLCALFIGQKLAEMDIYKDSAAHVAEHMLRLMSGGGATPEEIEAAGAQLLAELGQPKAKEAIEVQAEIETANHPESEKK